MSTITIGWLNKCRCGNKSHTVKTARGNESALWDDDAVKCNSCSRGGVIQVCEGQARVLWETDEEMAEGKPMSTITKEWLQQKIAEMEAARDEIPFGLDEGDSNTLAAMRIALASLEAEPVAWMYSASFERGHVEGELTDAPGCDMPVYTAPPAPVSVPECFKNAVSSLESLYRNGQKQNWNERYTTDMAYASGILRACRAAMLQGADGNAPAHFRSRPAQSSLSPAQGGNSPVIPDGWVDCSERMPREVLAALQNIARLRRNLNDFCGDKSVIAKCLIEAEEALLNAVNRHSTMLAAAPQQEAKNV